MTMDVVTAYLNKTVDADAIAQDKKLKYKKIASGELEYLGFNHENKYCSNSKFRIAIAKAIDSNKIIKYNYADAGVTSDSIYYPNFLGAKKDSTFNYEPKKATQLLKELKLKDRDEDGIIEDENKNPVTLRILVLNTNKQRLEAAETIIENLKEIGINADLISADADDYAKMLDSKEYDIYFGGIKLDKQFNLTDLYTTYNKIGFSDSKLLAQIYSLEQSLSREDQAKQFAALKKAINKDASYIPICYRAYWFLTVETLKNADKVSFFSPYEGAETWEWSKRKTE
jgi:ABC transporter, substrate-binding protein, family 5